MKLLRFENSRYLLSAMLLSFAVNSKAQLLFTDSGHRLGNGSSNDVALGDLDGDGDLDAFVINGDWNAEQPNEVWFNDGNGKYTVSDQVFGNSKCGEVGLADLDGDGDLDAFIAYYNYTGGEPDQIWFNDGTGHFTDSGQRLDHRNGGVALTDLDGDGDIDAFISNHVFDNGTNGNLKIWLNDSAGHFTDSGQELGNGNHTSVSLGDVDGDGDMDGLVTFNYGDAGNRIWLNDGHARFTQGPLISMTFSGDAKLGDLDGDGDLDIFLTHRGGNKIWINDGAGHFTDSGQVLGNSETSAVGLGDLDKDGDLDAFVLNAIYQNARTNEIWINNGAGIFTDSGLRPGYDQSYDVELGDLDGDKDLDAFVAITGPNKVWINGTYPSGYMQLSFTANGQNITSSTSWDIRLVDFDGDLDLDAYSENKVWLNNGAGLFAKTTTSFGAKDAYFADLNGDGFMDAVCNDSLFLNDKTFHYPFSGRITSNMQMTYAQPVDVDGDGDIDMIVADQYTDSLFINDGSGKFTTAKRSFGGWGQCRYEAGDINGDGNTDMVVGIPHTPPPEMLPATNKIWLRDNAGNYTLKNLDLSPNVQTRNINLADFDKDGDTDLLIAGCEPRSGNPYSTILQNDGNGNFSVKQKLNEGFRASDSKTADFDNDGDLDVFFSNGTPTENGRPNTLWLNDGLANFIDSDLRLGNANSLKAALGDLNADGKTDVFAVNAKLDPQNGYVAVACPVEVWLNSSHKFYKTGYENRFIEGFRYGVFIPPGYNPDNKYHLVVYLHGYSDTTSWNFGWYDEGIQHDFPCIVLTPKCLTSYTDGWGSSWNDDESYAMQMTYRIIDTIKKNYTVDLTRIHVCGTSMGGFGTFKALATHPGMFASAYAVCGGGNPSTASSLVNTPLWIFHGSNDQTVPVTQSRNMYNAILDAGGTHVRYTEYTGVGHNSWENVGEETTLDHWFLSQQKGSSHSSPDPVGSLQYNLNQQNQPYLEWTAPADESTDNKMIWCYRMYRNSTLLATLNNDVFNYTDMSVATGNQYTYQVKAMNYYFIEPSTSPEKSVTIPAPVGTDNHRATQGSPTVVPNPVDDLATLSFHLDNSGRAKIQIFNTLGQPVEKISDEVFPQGTHFVEWNTRNYDKGVYYASFEFLDDKQIIKILIN